MHSAVLQNKKYIRFAEENTVEVMALSRLEQGIEAGDRKAGTYEEKLPGGKTVEYLVEFPGLTVEDMLGLARSRARGYNDTRKIPYTAIVDPHSLEKMHSFSGSASAKSIMEEVTKARRELAREHDTQVTRSDYRRLVESESGLPGQVDAGEFKDAFEAIESLGKIQWPDELASRVDAMRRDVVAAAKARIDELASKAADDFGAKRDLRRLVSDLRGTELGDRAREALDGL